MRVRLGDVGGDAACASGVVCVALFCDGGGCIRVGFGFRSLYKLIVPRLRSIFPLFPS